MPDYYSEPFITLAGLTHKSALISWGAFYFRVKDSGEEFKLVDDSDLKKVDKVDHDDNPNTPQRVVHPPRSDTIGATSKPYGPARVVVKGGGKVFSAVAEPEKNHCWVPDLSPDTEYEYQVFVTSDGVEEPWADGPRRNWERRGGKMGLGPKSKAYVKRFRTFPAPTEKLTEPFTFAVIGDFGVGVKKEDSGQALVAAALEKAVDDHNVRFVLTTGDNIYRAGSKAGKVFGIVSEFLGGGGEGETGDEDDDWYFTYYQPYRYVINRVPVFPTIGNHDADETEDKDDRTQLFDNLYVDERVAGETGPSGRASVGPGLFYRFRFGSDVEFICIDSSTEEFQGRKTQLFKVEHHKQFLQRALSKADGNSPPWRIPFCHHPPFSAGQHKDTKGMEELVEQFRQAGVRLMLSGHSHNFQHNESGGVNYIVSGAAGKREKGEPDKSTKATRVSWADDYHFLLVTIDGKKATVRPIGALDGGNLVDVKRKAPGGDNPVPGRLVIELP